MIIKQNSRLQNHRITPAGILFSVPSSEDFTDGSWSDTDLMLGEIGTNLTDNRIFFRTTSGIQEIATIAGPSTLWKRDGSHNIVAIDDGSSPIAYPNILPPADNQSDLGSTSFQWKNLHLSGGAIVGIFAGSALPSPVKGMIVFNDTTGKFIGYDGTTWQNFY